MGVYNICMVSDFFYPNMGGVESHIYTLSQCLLEHDHKVVVITHSYGDRVGIRYMLNGLKVYYLPIKTFYNQVALPTLVASLPIIRYIFVREEIQIVHGHSSFSTLAHEAMLIARLLGLKVVFTDHSLFGFADASAVVTNKFLELSLANCNHCICVSHTGKENTVLRAKVPAEQVSVIPNAVDWSLFRPGDAKQSDRVTVISMSRLVYRKGIDLLAKVIPIICQKYPQVDFIIGGDGPKRLVLEQMKEIHNLHDRVTLLGGLNQNEVRNNLVKGDIFINTSLTEAFCMAIVEAASCGLQIVSTRVGGIPEVLPPDLIYLAEPDVTSIINALKEAINDRINGRFLPPNLIHKRIKEIYDWRKITQRTMNVYNHVYNEEEISISEKLSRYRKCGILAGPFFLLLVLLVHFCIRIVDWWIPRHSIDIARKIVVKKK
uniref:phosphatidylinositol N-acetylglucosaminyltransferase n=1 Tax=Lynceus sp. MCZ IZ 141354 TaxID=1930659 RepID=A0A9N6WUH8_9CRUS|nr:EOG090X0515 [Lynceus sp. MCZ IZ 141354]